MGISTPHLMTFCWFQWPEGQLFLCRGCRKFCVTYTMLIYKEVWKKMFSFQRGEDQVPSLFSEVMSHGSVGATPSAKKIRTFKTTCILGAVTFWPGGRGWLLKSMHECWGFPRLTPFFGQKPMKWCQPFSEMGECHAHGRAVAADSGDSWHLPLREKSGVIKSSFFGCGCFQK